MTTLLSSAVSSVGKAVRSVANSVRDWNTSTLSGAVDVIVVRRKAAHGFVYSSTPFHVKFGVFQVMKSSDHVVSIEINGDVNALKMKLSRDGYAYFPGGLWDDDSGGYSSLDEGLDETGKFDKSGGLEQSEEEKNWGGRMRLGLKAQRKRNFSEERPRRRKRTKDGLRQRRAASAANIKSAAGASMASAAAKESLEKEFMALSLRKCVGDRFDRLSSILDREELFSEYDLSLCKSEISAKQSGRGKVEWPVPLRLCFKEFYGAKVSFDQFKTGGVLSDESLVALCKGKVYPGSAFVSFAVARFVFGGAVEIDDFLLRESGDVFGKGGFGDCEALLSPTPPQPNKTPPPITHIADKQPTAKPKKPPTTQPKKPPKRRPQRRLKPTSAQLCALRLRPGPNATRFSVSSALQGTQLVQAAIYLWDEDARVVITDIDGTITKSDVLGFILPGFGASWAHKDVAGLFRRVRENGYAVLYVTARLISLSAITRAYLFGLDQQGGEQLPQGPILTVPLGLYSAYKRDHSQRPQDMKIQLLRDAQKIFPGKKPFYAGFGNKETDRISYEAVGVPRARIFIINRTGEIIKHNAKHSYGTISESVDQIFPPIDQAYRSHDVKFGLNYWKRPIKNQFLDFNDIEGIEN